MIVPGSNSSIQRAATSAPERYYPRRRRTFRVSHMQICVPKADASRCDFLRLNFTCVNLAPFVCVFNSFTGLLNSCTTLLFSSWAGLCKTWHGDDESKKQRLVKEMTLRHNMTAKSAITNVPQRAYGYLERHFIMWTMPAQNRRRKFEYEHAIVNEILRLHPDIQARWTNDTFSNWTGSAPLGNK